MQTLTEQQSPPLERKFEATLASLPRNKDDNDIVEGSIEEIPPNIVIPLVRNNILKAAFFHETQQQKALREEFNKNTLTPELWAAIAEYHQEFLFTYFDVSSTMTLGTASEHIQHNPTPTICIKTMQDHFDLLKAGDERILKTQSYVLAHPPKAGENGIAPVLHRDKGYPLIAHKTLNGGALRFLIGYLSEEERQLHFLEERSEYHGPISAERMATVPEGVTAVFGTTFLHESSLEIPEEGQLAITAHITSRAPA